RLHQRGLQLMTGNNLAMMRDETRDACARGRRTPPATAAWIALLSLAVLGACSGDNLFRTDNDAVRPRVTDLQAPEIAEAGDSIDIVVSGVAPMGISEVRLRLTGGAALDTVAAVSSTPMEVTRTFRVAMPPTFASDEIVVAAAIVDANSIVSQAESVTMIAFGQAAP